MAGGGRIAPLGGVGHVEQCFGAGERDVQGPPLLLRKRKSGGATHPPARAREATGSAQAQHCKQRTHGGSERKEREQRRRGEHSGRIPSGRADFALSIASSSAPMMNTESHSRPCDCHSFADAIVSLGKGQLQAGDRPQRKGAVGPPLPRCSASRRSAEHCRARAPCSCGR